MSDKPRKWWIISRKNGRLVANAGVHNGPKPVMKSGYTAICLIEKSAYDELLKQLAEARAEIEAMGRIKNFYSQKYKDQRKSKRMWRAGALTHANDIDSMNTDIESLRAEIENLKAWKDVAEARAIILDKMHSELLGAGINFDFQKALEPNKLAEAIAEIDCLRSVVSEYECLDNVHHPSCFTQWHRANELRDERLKENET